MFVLFLRVFTILRMGNLPTRIVVYACVVVKGIYTCKTGKFDNELLCLCLCFCRGYVHM